MTDITIVDTHCHLGPVDGDSPDVGAETESDSDGLVAIATEAGIARLVDVGIDLPTSERAVQRAARHPSVRATVGLHPCSAEHFDAQWPALCRLARESRPVALGETGFDLYWQPEREQDQERSFRAHLELARELDLSVVVHARDAFEQTFSVLALAGDLRVVWHCFSGGPEEAERAVDLGCWLSFAGPLTYKNSEALREAARRTPPDRVLVETDAPFLPPRSKRGERNRPDFVRETLSCLAEVRGWTERQAAEQTTANADRAFGGRILGDGA